MNAIYWQPTDQDDCKKNADISDIPNAADLKKVL